MGATPFLRLTASFSSTATPLSPLLISLDPIIPSLVSTCTLSITIIGYCTYIWGILVRLVMHLFWGEKYKDLWFYTLFYIYTLFVLLVMKIVKGNLTKSSNTFLETF